MSAATMDSVEEIWIKGVDIPLLKIKNLKIVAGPESKEVRFSGKTFPFILDHMFYHQILEGNAQYELIKTLVMDIKPVFMTKERMVSSSSHEDDTRLFLESLKNKANYFFLQGVYDEYKEQSEYKDIYILHGNSLVFDELYIFNDFTSLLSGATWTNGYKPFWEIDDFISKKLQPFVEICTSKIRDSFLKKMTTDPQQPKLLYISRKDATKRHKKYWDSLSIDQQNDPTLGESYFYLKRSFENESVVEKYYMDKGYTSVSFEGMPYMEQLSMIFNADKIVSASGSGLVNLFIARDTSEILELGAFSHYNQTYHWICDIVGSKWRYVTIHDKFKNHAELFNKLETEGV